MPSAVLGNEFTASGHETGKSRGSGTGTAWRTQERVNKVVALLLCTYDGERFLQDQLESFARQTYPHWLVAVSDDGSNDATLKILDGYRAKWGSERISVQKGPGQGFVANFLSLACDESINADYYAFADQDDVWEDDKLARALAWLNSVSLAIPAVYCSRTRLVDIENKEVGLSPLFERAPSFRNALVQSLAGGNTMVFNAAARALLLETNVRSGVVSHDWWVYLVVTGCGGAVYYDPYPAVRYRQHEQNLVGSNMHWNARLDRMRWLLRGRLRTWSGQHIEGLGRIRNKFPKKNQTVLDSFIDARHATLGRRIIGFAKCKIYRQTFLGNLGLLIAVLLKKI